MGFACIKCSNRFASKLVDASRRHFNTGDHVKDEFLMHSKMALVISEADIFPEPNLNPANLVKQSLKKKIPKTGIILTVINSLYFNY
jgi:hypothetical protein